MLFKKLWRTMGLYKAQFISMIIMIALGVGIFVGFNMEWSSIDTNMSRFFDETGYADYRIISEKGFTEDDLDKISAIKGVDKAAHYLSVNADVKEYDGDALALTVTTDADVSGIKLMQGEKYDKSSADGIWLSDKYADANGVKLGDKLTLTYKGITLKGEVKGLIKAGEYLICTRDESQLMPDFNTYGFAYISPKMYREAAGFDFYSQINVISSLSKKDFTEKADKALGATSIILTKDESASYSAANGEIEEGKTMGSVMPVLFLMIAVLTMVTTMHRLTAKEKTQIGTLKALGFKDKRILRHYTSYAFMIGIIGSVFGIGIGFAVAYLIMNPNGAMGTYMDLPYWSLSIPTFCYIVMAALIVALTFIGFLSVKKMLKGTAADALRPYSPKKVKPMLIERTGWFHKLSFGTRWNMRDVIRHKARTAMSLIGIAGSTLLIVGALGMGDTMNAFIDLYYGDATNYSSRIFIAEDADDEARDKLIRQYDGDWSASTSVQLNDKAVTLNVCNADNDLVRFPDVDANFIKLKDDGAYICMRIADDNNLSVGDSFIVSPYGTDKKYKLKVAGIIRSVSESISISPAYADRLGISYTPDSVYTKTVKSDVKSSDSIKSVQSKQMIVDSFDTFTDMLNVSVSVLIGAALLLGVVVLYNLGVMSYTERYREMATLKVVGFKDKRIGHLLIEQNLWLSLVGVIIGIPLGIAALDYLLKALAGEYEMKLAISAGSIIISILLAFGMSLLVSLMVSRKNKKIDMVEALKGAE